MKMRTGLLDVGGSSMPIAVKELMTAFIAVFNRQCISKGFVYLFHNALDSEEEFNQSIIRGLKYGALSPYGIGAEVKPYLKLAIDQGFLSLEDCEENPFAQKALELYVQIHNEWQMGGQTAATKWAFDYAMLMLTDIKAVTEEALLANDIDEEQAEEIEAQESSYDEVNEEESIEEECSCEFCMEMRGYDQVDLATIQTDDPLDALVINGLRDALLQYPH